MVSIIYSIWILNSEQKQKITLRKTLFELMNNAENLRKFRDIKLVTTNQEVA